MFTRKSENFNSKKENFELYQAIWKEILLKEEDFSLKQEKQER